MRFARWLDHLPPWLAYGAVATTGIYEPWELSVMVVPLLAAGVVEGLRLDLGRWRLRLELVTLALVILDFVSHRGFFGVVIRILFMLMGLRLALPRAAAQRRQLLLMGFLLFLSTAISTADLSFIGWTVAWLVGSILVLLQLSWEHSASLRRGPTLAPPFRRVPRWALGALLLSSGFFVMMPRLTLGWRPLPALGAALGTEHAGLNDRVDLDSKGPILPNGEVVMRVIPPKDLRAAQLAALGQGLGYFRGFTLEAVEGMSWESTTDTPTSGIEVSLNQELPPTKSGDLLPVELNLVPTPMGLIPLPYGAVSVATPFGPSLRRSRGGSLRLPRPVGGSLTIKLLWRPASSRSLLEVPPRGRRRSVLTYLGPEHASAKRLSREWEPEPLPAQDAAARLSTRLRTFEYTLDNRSGTAANPLEDFLENSRAGHCEFFASSLALMLRARGIPARVVNGYRLGPWVPEGGYFLVTQNEAHAWVEFWDDSDQRWHMADGSPIASSPAASGLMGAWDRWADVVRYQWNRYVVRFSDEDQLAGLGKVKDLASSWRWQWRKPSMLGAGAVALVLLGWVFLRLGPLLREWAGRPGPPQGIRALRPLLARARQGAEPLGGETARAWLTRLARIRPDRAAPLAGLAEAVDLVAYGEGHESGLHDLVREETRAWRRKPPTK